MYTNTDCTIFLNTDSGFDRLYISACYMQSVRAEEIKKYGAEAADSIKVIIPYRLIEGEEIPEGSYIAEGIPETADMTELIRNNIVFYITSVTPHKAGSSGIHHVTIKAR